MFVAWSVAVTSVDVCVKKVVDGGVAENLPASVGDAVWAWSGSAPAIDQVSEREAADLSCDVAGDTLYVRT